MPPCRELPHPDHYDSARTEALWRVPYQARAADARRWARHFELTPAHADRHRVGLLLIDLQNTFCLPDGELFVAGRDGRGAVDDCNRIASFIYRHLGRISRIVVTLDTHSPAQIFHPHLLIGPDGEPPPPMTPITAALVQEGRYRLNHGVATSAGLDADAAYLAHYTQALAATGKFELMVWPYHAMLGGVGHALVPAIEEAVFFHSIARSTEARFELKGRHALTENYSALAPEVRRGPGGQVLAETNHDLLAELLGFDTLIVAGEAKSHCVAWTVADLLVEIQRRDQALAKRVYLLDDAASPVVVPGVVDFTTVADEAYAGFAAAGMHRVRTDLALADWPGCEVLA